MTFTPRCNAPSRFPAFQLPLFRPATSPSPSSYVPMILGKSVENVLQIEFHSRRVYPRYTLFFFFSSLSLSLSRPIETCFFRTEFLEQFVTIPAVLSPVCNIEILQLVWNFQCFSGETSCGSKIRYLIRESAIIMIFIAWIFICNRIYSFFVQDLPRRYFLFLCTLYDLLLRNLLRYFFFLRLPW